MKKIFSDLWKGQLHNAARISAGQLVGRKILYFRIAKEDIKRLDLFKLAQYLFASCNQLALL